MNRLPFLALLLLAPLALAADSPAPDKPKSPAAVAAVAKADKAVAEAEATAKANALKARQQEVDELKAAQRMAMQSNELAEANAIDAEAKRVQAEVDRLTGGAPAATGETPAAWLGGTSWRFKDNRVTVRYLANGTVEATSWAKPGTWSAGGPASIVQVEPNTRTSVTFSSDRRHALWVYAGGEIAWATRIN